MEDFVEATFYCHMLLTTVTGIREKISTVLLSVLTYRYTISTYHSIHGVL